MIAPEVLSGLAAVSRVSRALVGTGELPVLAAAALEEMREALQLDDAALYLPDADGQPILRRYVGTSAPELSFDEEAWRLAIAGGAPIVLREPASWLVENPFTPPARDWLILPLVAGEMVGVVLASATRADPDRPAERDRPEPARPAAVRRNHHRAAAAGAAARGDGARAAHARGRGPRRARAAPRRRPARAGPREPDRERLTEAVDSAHRLVRHRLQELSSDAPVDLRHAIEAAAKRCKTAVKVCGQGEAGPEAVSLAARIVSEALANADAHAQARTIKIDYAATDDRLDVRIADDGRGFDPSTAPGVEDGHLGLTVMRQRARGHGGECEITSSPDTGTLVTLWIPL